MNIGNELRDAWRGLIRRPRFLVQAALTLATGVAASTLLFSLVAGTLLTPPAVPDPDSVVVLHRPASVEADLGQPDIGDIRAEVREFGAVGLIWDGYAFDTVFGDRPERINGALVDKGYFDAIAAPALLGRTFGAAEDGPAAARVAVLSERLWRNRFAADRDIVGRVLTLNGLPFEVIGVARDATDVLQRDIQLWAPAAIGGDWVYTARGAGVFEAIARLAPGASLPAANAKLETVMRRLADEYPDSNRGKDLQATAVQPFLAQGARTLLWVLQAATLVLLLVGVVNVMSLLLVRGVVRQQELAIRNALGAARARLTRVQLYEGAIVGAAGALLGALLAWAALDAVLRFARPALPANAQASLDPAVLGFAVVLALLAGVVAAAIPALRASGVAGSAHRATRSRGVREMLDGLMASEIALACALAIGASVLLRSLVGLSAVPLGFEPDGVLGAELVLPDSRYLEIDRQSDAVQRTVDAIGRQPGVEQAAFVVGAPLREGCCIGHDFVVEGRSYERGELPSARVRPVLGDYFGVLDIPLLQGRDFSADDDRDAPRVAIVNRRFAEAFFPGEDAVGKRISWPPGAFAPEADGPQWMSIVGVVDDVKSGSLRRSDSVAIYFPYLQRSQEWIRFGTLLARTHGEPMGYADAMQEALGSVDPLIPLQDVRSLRDRADAAVAPERFAAGLATAFGALALALALQGVVTVLGFAVAQRRAELGVRAALGADARRLGRLLVGQGVRAAAAGVALGVMLALAASSALDSLVFEVASRDATSYAGVALALTLFAALAAWWPARQAARVAPAEALRHE
jgi:putative ABC transport system permease protein